MPEIGAARGVTKHTDLTNKEDALGVIDHANKSVTMAKLVQEVQDLINGALQRSGGTMTGDVDMDGHDIDSIATATAEFVTLDRARFVSLTADPASPGEGDVWYRTDLKRLRLYSDPDIQEFVKRSGDTMTGDLDLDAGKTVDGVDVSEHVAASPVDHPDLSVTMAKLAQEVQDLINGALQTSGGTMTGQQLFSEVASPIVLQRTVDGYTNRLTIQIAEPYQGDYTDIFSVIEISSEGNIKMLPYGSGDPGVDIMGYLGITGFLVLGSGLTVHADCKVDAIGKGYVVYSPNGTPYRIRVNNDGTLFTEAA